MLISFSYCRLASSTCEVYGCWRLWAHIFSALPSERKELSPRSSWEKPREGVLPTHEGWGYCDWPSLSLVPAPRKLLWLGCSMISSSAGCWECEVVISSFPKRKERFVSHEEDIVGIQSMWSPLHTLFEPLLPSLHSPYCYKNYLPKMSLFWASCTLAQHFSQL